MVVLADREVSTHISCDEMFEGDKDSYGCSYAVIPNPGLATDSSTAAKYMQRQLSRQTENSHGKCEHPRR